MENPQVRILHLKKGKDRKYDVHRIQKGYVLRFLLDSSLHNYMVRLFCNHPLMVDTPFHRSTYHELHWQCSTKMRSALTDVFAEIIICHAGSFNYYFTIDESAIQSKAVGQGYFLVDPTLTVNGQPVALDGLCMQTVITKLLGPFNEWESRLTVTKEAGYNMIHFTPVQELGISNSAYCIRDQHRLSPAYSPDKRLTYLMMPHLQDLVEKMHNQWGVFSMTDLVLNHTALDAPLLECYPQCAYNMDNSPHLRPAYLVDRILYNFSLEVADNRWEHRSVPAEPCYGAHFDAMRHILECEVFPAYRIPEFYQCHVDNVLREFSRAVQENRAGSPYSGEVTLQQHPQFHRLKSSVDMDLAVKVFFRDRIHRHYHSGDFSETCSQGNVEKSFEDLKNHLNWLNQQKQKEVWDHIHAAIENFVKNGFYRFADGNGLKLGRVSKENPIMEPYFVSPATHEGSVETAEMMMNKEPHLVMALSGWVIGDKLPHNFAEDLLAPESNVYLRRELIPWGDNIKLRYGQTPEDCPPLWEHMRIYAERTAQIFHGIRLDNTHSTPLHVAEYMLDAARRQQPELYVVAELFTGDSDMDHYFINRLGINCFAREVLRARSPEEMRRLVADFSGEPLGSFAQPRVLVFLPSEAPALFCDQTHHNDTPIKTHSVYSVWPNAAVAAMTRCAIGSNRGYDELVPHHIDTVKETRLYPYWTKNGSFCEGVDLSSGIMRGKRHLNLLHRRLAQEGYTEVCNRKLGTT